MRLLNHKKEDNIKNINLIYEPVIEERDRIHEIDNELKHVYIRWFLDLLIVVNGINLNLVKVDENFFNFYFHDEVKLLKVGKEKKNEINKEDNRILCLNYLIV